MKPLKPAEIGGPNRVQAPVLTRNRTVPNGSVKMPVVPGTGLEPASREAADFKSAMFTNFITPAGVAIARGREFYHCQAGAPNRRIVSVMPATIPPPSRHPH